MPNQHGAAGAVSAFTEIVTVALLERRETTPARGRLAAEEKVMRASVFIVPVLCALLATTGCKTVSAAAGGVKSAGETVASGVSSVAGAGTSLVNVNLSNVLNDLAVKLNIDKANIPINAQIPITIAANVCGVSINILSISNGGSSKGCTAVTTSPQLAQAVQQQMSTGGGTQTNTAPATTTPPTTTTPTTTQPTTTTQPPPATTTPPQSD
jgi:hypothetical protein